MVIARREARIPARSNCFDLIPWWDRMSSSLITFWLLLSKLTTEGRSGLTQWRRSFFEAVAFDSLLSSSVRLITSLSLEEIRDFLEIELEGGQVAFDRFLIIGTATCWDSGLETNLLEVAADLESGLDAFFLFMAAGLESGFDTFLQGIAAGLQSDSDSS